MKYLKTYESSIIVSEIKELLLRDCKKYLIDIKKIKKRIPEYFLYRGLHIDEDISIEKLEVDKHRTPVDTNVYVNNYVNNFFENKFGIRLREECVFTSSIIIGGSLYGPKFLFFPIGDYKAYTSEKIEDFYSDVSLYNSKRFLSYITNMETTEVTPDLLEKFTIDVLRLQRGIAIEHAKTILEEKKEFDKLLDSYKKYDGVEYNMMTEPNEIMIECDEYYVVSTDYIEDIKKLISNLID